MILPAKIYWISNDMFKTRAFEKYANKHVTNEPPCAVDCDAKTERAYREGLPSSLHLPSFPAALPSVLVISLTKLFEDTSQSVEG